MQDLISENTELEHKSGTLEGYRMCSKWQQSMFRQTCGEAPFNLAKCKKFYFT